jgi:hypothetical protein
MRTDPPDVATIERTIRAYLAAHPHAGDTVEGIRAWWLGDGACAPDVVRTALDRLVAAGVLEARTLGDGSVVYGARGGAERDGNG